MSQVLNHQDTKRNGKKDIKQNERNVTKRDDSLLQITQEKPYIFIVCARLRILRADIVFLVTVMCRATYQTKGNEHECMMGFLPKQTSRLVPG